MNKRKIARVLSTVLIASTLATTSIYANEASKDLYTLDGFEYINISALDDLDMTHRSTADGIEVSQNGKTTIWKKDDILTREGRTYIPMKETMEAFAISFSLGNDDTWTLKKENEVLSYKTIMEQSKPEDLKSNTYYDDGKDKEWKKDEVKNELVLPRVSPILYEENDSKFIIAKSNPFYAGILTLMINEHGHAYGLTKVADEESKWDDITMSIDGKELKIAQASIKYVKKLSKLITRYGEQYDLLNGGYNYYNSLNTSN